MQVLHDDTQSHLVHLKKRMQNSPIFWARTRIQTPKSQPKNQQRAYNKTSLPLFEVLFGVQVITAFPFPSYHNINTTQCPLYS